MAKCLPKLEINVPVYADATKPIMRNKSLPIIFTVKPDGLDEPGDPPTRRRKHSCGEIYHRYPDGKRGWRYHLVPVGPLSNIAVAMRMQPAILPKIREIVLMGGAYGTGNFTPSAEFNIFADPEAARVVFTSGVPLVMMGLDLTNQTVSTPDVIARMERAGGPCAESCSATS